MNENKNLEVITKVKQKVNPILLEVKKLKIKDDEGMRKAIDLLAMIKNRIKFVESKRKERTKPINQALRAINRDFKVVREPLDMARESVEDAMRNYRGLIAKIQAAQTIKATETGKFIPTKPQVQSSGKSAIRVKMVPKFRIIDKKKIPSEFLKVDEMAVRRALREGIREIPGLEIWEEEQIASYN